MLKYYLAVTECNLYLWKLFLIKLWSPLLASLSYIYSTNAQYSKMFDRIQKTFSRPLNCIVYIPPQVCNGYVRKRWCVASVFVVTSHKEWMWLVHFQCCRLWKSIFLIVCRNWSIFVRWAVLSSQLLNSNFKFYNSYLLGSREKQTK